MNRKNNRRRILNQGQQHFSFLRMFLKLLSNGTWHESYKLCLYSTSMEKTPLHGSYHWLAERSLSVLTLSLIILSPLSSLTSLLNLGLSITLPLHSHFGFSAIITDYLPQRKYPCYIHLLVAHYGLQLVYACMVYGYLIQKTLVSLKVLKMYGQPNNL